MKRILVRLKKIWKDAVGGKLISVGILALIGIGWAWYEKKTPSDLYKITIQVLNLSVPLYLLLSLICLFFITRFLVKRFKKRSDPLCISMIGEYTFGELCHILSVEKTTGRTMNMELNKVRAPDTDLLVQFYKYAPFLSMGVEIDHHGDRGYLWGIFCPTIMKYGLIEQIKSTHREFGRETISYKTSVAGYKFLALLDKHMLRTGQYKSFDKKS